MPSQSTGPRAFLVSFLCCATLLLVATEAVYRAWLYRSNVVDVRYGVVTMDYPYPRGPFYEDVRGPHPANTPFEVRQYGLDGGLVRSNCSHANNLGWISRNDVAQPKGEHEYRIAILGDSLTASVNNCLPWPDVVRSELAARGGANASVINLGNPGMAPGQFANLTLPVAERLEADLVVVNMVAENMISKYVPRRMPLAPSAPPFVVDGIEIPFNCPPRLQLGRSCSLSPSWYVPRGTDLTREELTRVKQLAARAVLLRQLTTATSLLALSSPEGTASAAPSDRAERIAEAIGFLQAIKARRPDALITLNPLAWYSPPAQEPPILTEFLAASKAARLEVVDMRDRLPAVDPGERESWYNLPHDGHWSDKGAAIFGRAMALLILERHATAIEARRRAPASVHAAP